LSKKQDPLEQLSNHVDFEFFRKPLEKFFNKDADPSSAGFLKEKASSSKNFLQLPNKMVTAKRMYFKFFMIS